MALVRVYSTSVSVIMYMPSIFPSVSESYHLSVSASDSICHLFGSGLTE